MKNQIRHNLLVQTSIILALSMPLAMASTCPTELLQQHQGRWVSHAPPGWLSNTSTEHGMQVDPNNFEGVVYSPKQQRLACVYKVSNGALIAMISNKDKKLKLTYVAGKKHQPWHYHKNKNDYSCGKPQINKISGCHFKL
jgi:hypothetical protein